MQVEECMLDYAFHFYSCFNVDHVWRNKIQVHFGKVDACTESKINFIFTITLISMFMILFSNKTSIAENM